MTIEVDERYLTPAEYATRRATTVDTLELERHRGRGPRYMKFGRSVRYPLSEVLAYEKASLVDPAERRRASA